MADVANLNRARKERARDTKRAQANENAVKFGRTKAERVAEAALEAKACKMLDQHALDKE